MRKDIQHLKLEVKSQKSEVSEKQHFTTAEGIEVKPTYTKEDIDFIVKCFKEVREEMK